MLILAVNLRVPRGEQAALRPAMEAVIAASRAEPGCLAYTFGVDVLDPDIIRVFEVYADDDALLAHSTSEHFKTWRAISGKYPREERRLYDANLKA